jgi:aspartate carbamoyltransferase catalytic subunit
MLKHILSAEQFTQDDLKKLTNSTERFKKLDSFNDWTSARGKLLGTLFFEPSTRTRWSTEAAMLKLGGQVISMENACQSSSDKKGETLEDTIRTVSNYCDVLAVRHPKAGIVSHILDASSVPIINCGDGHNEHPTQALLDYYTIQEHFGSFDRLNILFTGDVTYSRTIRSLSYLLKEKVQNIYKTFVKFPDNGPGINVNISEIEKILPEMDIVYMTRNQVERKNTWDEGWSNFIMTESLAKTLKENAIIMHPLPRNNEIDREVDKLPCAKYFEQAKNGLYMRMALLKHIIQVE